MKQVAQGGSTRAAQGETSDCGRPEFDLPGIREIGKIPLRHD